MKDSFASKWEKIKKGGSDLFEKLPDKVKETVTETEIKGLAEKAKAMIGEVPGTNERSG